MRYPCSQISSALPQREDSLVLAARIPEWAETLIDYFPEAKRLPVSPGSYRVRVYYGGLNTLSEDGLDGEDHYQVVLWPEKYRSPEVLKKWPSL